MSPLQVAQAIQSILQARVWSGGGGEKMFGSVHITRRNVKPEAIANLILPCALVQIGTATHDPWSPGFIPDQRIHVVIVAAVAGDALGENVLVGANKTAKTSHGRGLYEIAPEVHNAIQYLGPVQGVTLQHVGTSDGEVDGPDSVRYAGYLDLEFKAICTTQPA